MIVAGGYESPVVDFLSGDLEIKQLPYLPQGIAMFPFPSLSIKEATLCKRIKEVSDCSFQKKMQRGKMTFRFCIEICTFCNQQCSNISFTLCKAVNPCMSFSSLNDQSAVAFLVGQKRKDACGLFCYVDIMDFVYICEIYIENCK